MDDNKFGNYIKKRRIELGFTQESVAAAMYISKQSVSNWELGKTIPTRANITRLAIKLDVSKNDLLDLLDGEPADDNMYYEKYMTLESSGDAIEFLELLFKDFIYESGNKSVIEFLLKKYCFLTLLYSMSTRDEYDDDNPYDLEVFVDALSYNAYNKLYPKEYVDLGYRWFEYELKNELEKEAAEQYESLRSLVTDESQYALELKIAILLFISHLRSVCYDEQRNDFICW